MLRYHGLARSLARRYARPGLPYEDLEQVACLGLVKAIKRFEPSRDCAFSTYAVPTILGELRHYCRQTLWPVHVPRLLQERVVAVRRLTNERMAVTGRPPTVEELAAMLDCDPEEILDAVHAGGAFVTRSFDGDAGDDPEAAPVAERWLAVDDPGYRAVEDRVTLQATIGALTETERELVQLRFMENLSHRQIGRRMEMSPSHVARLLTATIERLADGPEAAVSSRVRSRTRRGRRPRLRAAA